MKSLIFFLIVLSLHSLAAAEPVPDSDHPINHALGIKVPGKVNLVTWSIQKSVCTVQLDSPSVRDGEPLPTVPLTQA